MAGPSIAHPIPSLELGGGDSKVSEVMRIVERAGWVLVRTRGSHRQYKHPTRPGVVTIPGNLSADLALGTLRSFFRQAGIEA